MLQTLQTTAQPANQQWLQPSDDVSQVQPQPSAQQQNFQQVTEPEVIPDESIPPAEINDQQKLATFEAILSEMEIEKQQSTQTPPEFSAETVQVADTATVAEAPAMPQSQPPAYSTSGIRKEQAPGMGTATAELPGGMQYIDSEPSPEISEEVESFLQKVEQDPSQLPQEIVIAAQEHAASVARALPQDVKVLPITQAQEIEGKKKNTTFSIKWLVTFSAKLTEIFKGKAVYRTE
jgi:hypothetical protein